MKTLNKEILRLALPSILANITVPIVGMVDVAVAGHIGSDGFATAAAFIGSISVGSMLFDLLYWNFAFLRVGTGGLTAQALGRGDMKECGLLLARALLLALGLAALTLAVQWPSRSWPSSQSIVLQRLKPWLSSTFSFAFGPLPRLSP